MELKNKNETSKVINFFGAAESVTQKNIREIDRSLTDKLYVHLEVIEASDIVKIYTMSQKERERYSMSGGKWDYVNGTEGGLARKINLVFYSVLCRINAVFNYSNFRAKIEE